MTGGGQGQTADALAGALAAVMVPVAQRAQRVSSTAPTPEVVDLGELARYLVEHTRRVMSGASAHDWAEVADALTAATKACRLMNEHRGATPQPSPCLTGENDDRHRRPMTEIEIQEGLRAGVDVWFVVRVDTQGTFAEEDLHVCADPVDAERLAEIERDNHRLPPSRQVGPGQPPLIYPEKAMALGAAGTLSTFSRAVELCVAAELLRLAEQDAEPTRDLLGARAAWLRRVCP
jgi:hypothetical protein